MKWINLSECQPETKDSWGKLFWKHVDSGCPFHIKEIDGKNIINMGGFSYPYSAVEWLDESEEADPRLTYKHLKEHIEELQIKYDGLVESINSIEKGMVVIKVPEGTYIIPPGLQESDGHHVEDVPPLEKLKPYMVGFNKKLMK